MARKLFILVSTLMLLAACSAPPERLTVASITPKNGETDVSTSTTVVVGFSGAIDPATAEGNFVLLGANREPVAARIVPGLDDRTLVLMPDVELAVGTEYTVVLDDLIASPGRLRLAARHDSTFTTASTSAGEPGGDEGLPNDGDEGEAGDGEGEGGNDEGDAGGSDGEGDDGSAGDGGDDEGEDGDEGEAGDGEGEEGSSEGEAGDDEGEAGDGEGEAGDGEGEAGDGEGEEGSGEDGAGDDEGEAGDGEGEAGDGEGDDGADEGDDAAYPDEMGMIGAPTLNGSALSVTFDREVTGFNVTPSGISSSFKVGDPATIDEIEGTPGSIVSSDDGNGHYTVTLLLDTPLEPGTYTVVITTLPTDAEGNSYSQDQYWTLEVH